MKKLNYLICGVLMIVALVGCNKTASNKNENDTITITDMMKREVVVPNNVDNVICIGAGSLRLYSYVAPISKLSGVEEVEKSDSKIKLPKRPYQVLYQNELDMLPSCGIGGPKGQVPDMEKIIACKPDVIFSTIKDVEVMNDVTAKTNRPVVILNYGSEGPFGPEVKESLSLIGEVMDMKTRANEINSYIDSLIDDLDTRTKDLCDSEKTNVYLGALGNFGMHGLEFSQANNNILNVCHIKNVLDGMVAPGPEAKIDEEILKTINPELVIIDAGGYSKTIAELNDKEHNLKSIFEGWDAFKNGNVYVELPYKVYYMQVEIGFCNAYFNSKLAHGEAFSDLDIEAKCIEIFKEFYGKDCYKDYVAKAGLSDIVFKKLVY